MTAPIRLLTPEEMAEADRRTAAAGIPTFLLMQRAAAAIADRVLAVRRQRASEGEVLVLCGPGNNGGDGFAAAALLAGQGVPVRLALLGPVAALKGDAVRAAAGWAGAIEDAAHVVIRPAGLVVDALFGAGLARDLGSAAADLVQRVGASGVPVLAVDLPSGIDGRDGQVRGIAIRAEETVTFAARKPGHLLLPGRQHCGAVHVADIGIAAETIDAVGSALWANEPDLWRAAFPHAALDAHKYKRGHAVVVSGGVESSGAARMAARACLRIGAGLVTVACPPSALLVQAMALEAVMVRRAEGAEGLAELLSDERKNAVLLGPGLGLGDETAERVLATVRLGRAVTLDADALTSAAKAPDDLFDVIHEGGGPTVLTPHEGEFHRLFPDLGEESSKIVRAREAAARSGAVVLYKGPDTVVAAPDGRVSITANAPPWLATAGSGDVLAGLVTGLLAQHMPAFEAASAAAWVHGEAAATFGPGLIAEDIQHQVPAVLRRLWEQAGG